MHITPVLASAAFKSEIWILPFYPSPGYFRIQASPLPCGKQNGKQKDDSGEVCVYYCVCESILYL